MAQRLAMIDVVRFRRDWLSKDINGVWRVMLYRQKNGLERSRFAADAFACRMSAAGCKPDKAIGWGHKEMTYDPPSQNDARGTRAS